MIVNNNQKVVSIMSRKTFNIVLTIITVVSLLTAFTLTSMSIQISRNKATNKAKEEILGTWTDIANPQMIIQFTSENEYKVMGQIQAIYSVDPNNSIITLNLVDELGGNTEYYEYVFNSNHSQITLTNVDTGVSTVYSR